MLKSPVLEKKHSSELNTITRNNNIISGYASVFNIVDSHNDLIMPQAFDTSIIRHKSCMNVKLLWQHNPEEPIGSIDDLYVDHVGLIMSASINQHTQRGREIIALIVQKAITGLSIGFKVIDHNYNRAGVRIINKADLWEISVVTFPANEHAQINLPNHKDFNLINSFNKALNVIIKLNNQ